MTIYNIDVFEEFVRVFAPDRHIDLYEEGDIYYVRVRRPFRPFDGRLYLKGVREGKEIEFIAELDYSWDEGIINGWELL